MQHSGLSVAFAAGTRPVGTELTASIARLMAELRELGSAAVDVTSVANPSAFARTLNDKALVVYVVPDAAGEAEHGDLREFVRAIRAVNAELPLFLFGEQLTARQLPTEVLREIEGVINAYEDTPEFVARTLQREATRYVERLAPPFFRALTNYANDGAYSWHCPGHSGGTAFLKSPAGTLFHQFFGENLLRSDVCNAVEELGQLLDHTGPVAESEARAAETFGADHLYFVTNGTSTSNKIVWNSAVGPGDIVLVDRNCHKSILHAIMLTGAIPIYLMPTRNRAGIIGPIPRSEFDRAEIRRKIEAHPFIADKTRTPRILTLTQSTYDGIVYNAAEIKRTLDGHVDVLHFDEAWLPHARFHELYRGMHAVDDRAERTERSLVYATQSTHKLLAGLSQASQILVQNADSSRLDTNIFNEAYLMHTSTSPQYAIIASCDISAEMMRGVGGHALIEEAITEAMEFRRAIIRIGDEQPEGDWWFGVWGPDTPPREGLAKRSEWELTSEQTWHGFDAVDDGFTMLDPIKVTLTTPGLSTSGEFGESGIPGLVLSKYLAEHGVVVEKTGLYSLFILFTIGVTKGRWNTLIAELHRFKRLYDRDVEVREAMPEFADEHPQYAELGLRELCDRLHAAYRGFDIANLTTDIYLDAPEVALLPTDAWAAMTSGCIEHVAIDDLAGRVTAVLLTPYPPGIPLLVPGERVTERIVEYLRVEAELAAQFPGFNGITHGLGTAADGTHTVACVVE
ncbi:arginine/lysine/ornithine decarboxylase [Gulosibacter sediminis]|uniref:arginine/lysine/ornithine decarboxylase n=1 Tax=Gulosibacter sediminis TaxID=1729695 RepID=UPI0024A840E0|nr:arginine/lysine/ornithine decarboxylase [Gulosibacter sediminis]